MPQRAFVPASPIQQHHLGEFAISGDEKREVSAGSQGLGQASSPGSGGINRRFEGDAADDALRCGVGAVGIAFAQGELGQAEDLIGGGVVAQSRVANPQGLVAAGGGSAEGAQDGVEAGDGVDLHGGEGFHGGGVDASCGETGAHQDQIAAVILPQGDDLIITAFDVGAGDLQVEDDLVDASGPIADDAGDIEAAADGVAFAGKHAGGGQAVKGLVLAGGAASNGRP